MGEIRACCKGHQSMQPDLEEPEELMSSATWQEPIMLEESYEAPESTPTATELTERQLQLSRFIEKAARCFSDVQVKKLRVKFVEGDESKCGVCGVGFWGGSIGMTLPKQRHHCYCCGKALCNACTVTVQMENGHKVDGQYRKDFVWMGRFCIDHDLISGEAKEIGKANESEWSLLPKGPLAWLGFVVKVGSMLVRSFPSSARSLPSTRSASRCSGPTEWSVC